MVRRVIVSLMLAVILTAGLVWVALQARNEKSVMGGNIHVGH